ncbi:MAG: acyltransferase family protein [Synechococcaceae cyanobacterium]
MTDSSPDSLDQAPRGPQPAASNPASSRSQTSPPDPAAAVAAAAEAASASAVATKTPVARLPEPGSYRPEIDGLRAVAVLAVLINHINHKWLPGGYLGVDLFFVISGWVVTGSLLRHSHSSWRQFLLGFYARRVRRLLPALIACVLISSLLGSLLIAPQALERIASLRTGLASLVGLSNLYQLRQSTDYFGSSAELNLFTHTWSLGVEEQYYLVYPLLVGACGLVRGRPERVRRRLILALTALSLASLLLQGHLWTQDQDSAAFFLTSARFWELGLGALGSLLLPALGQRLARRQAAQGLASDGRLPLPFAGWMPALGRLAFALLLASFVMPLSLLRPATLLAGFSSALLLPALVAPSPLRTLLSHPRAVALGLRTYSLYLWHWPLLVLARWSVGLEGPWLGVVLLLVALSSEASYRWLETPLRRGRWAASNLGTMGRGLLLLLLGGAALLGLERRGEALFIGQHRSNEGPWFATVGVAGTALRGDRCNAIPSDGPRLPAPLVRDCRVSASRPGARPIALLGDSHALHLLPPLEAVNQRHGLPVLALSRSACAMPAASPSVQQGCLPFCQAAVEQALAFTAAAAGTAAAAPAAGDAAVPAGQSESAPPEPGGIVLLSNYLFGHFRAGGDLARQFRRADGSIAADPAANLTAWGESIGALAGRLQRQGGTLVVVAPTPEQRTRFGHPQLCRSDWCRPRLPEVCRRSSTSRAQLVKDRQPILQVLRRQASRHPNLLIFDPFDRLCPAGGDCATELNGSVLFRDKDHLSAAAVRRLTPDFEALLRRHGLL